MSTGRTINTISIQLRLLLRKINNRLLATLMSHESIAPHKTAGNPLVAELNSWQRQLELFQRQLDRIGDNLDYRQTYVQKVPRAHRYREQQSINSGRDNLDQVQSLANEVQGRLKQLVHRMLVPGDVEAINKSFDLLSDAIKETRELEEWIEKAARAGTLTRHDASELRTEIAEAKAYYTNQTQPAPAGVDWLLMLTVLVRVAHMIALKTMTKRAA